MTFHSPKPSWRELFDMGLYATEAARIRSVTIHAAMQWAKRNKTHWPDGRTHQFAPQKSTAIPCVVRGKTYPSIGAAERALGLKSGTITYHLNHHGHADYAGLHGRWTRGRKSPHAKPICVAGVDYPSITAAARDLRLGRHTLREWMSSNLDARGNWNVLRAAMCRDARLMNSRMNNRATDT